MAIKQKKINEKVIEKLNDFEGSSVSKRMNSALTELKKLKGILKGAQKPENLLQNTTYKPQTIDYNKIKSIVEDAIFAAKQGRL